MAPDANRERVLIYAPIGRDARASAEVIGRLGRTCEICTSVDHLLELLRAGAAAALLAEEGLFGKDLSALTTWVEQQPAWSDLPFVVLTSHVEQPTVANWRRHLVAVLRNVSLLERPVQTITLISAVQAALRARSRQYELRVLLEAQQRAAQELENLVLHRTRELESANEQLRKEMAERARVEESLRQAQKIEALGQLTGGVAHDFNNLLMVLLGGLEMLDRAGDSQRRALLMDGMKQAAHRGASLTKQLLAFSRRQALQPQTIDLSTHIGGMRELLDRSLRGDIHVQLDFSADLWPVMVDPGELELVILNLAVNARDAMPKGGTIRICGTNVMASDRSEHEGEYVRLSVIDTGTGMSDEVKQHVFEPFFTTKEIGKGSGLGLAQVYGFAKQSGGSVEIESQVGHGTTVTLLLPRSTEIPECDSHQRVRLQVQETAGAQGCVLLVEDNDEVATLVREMLNELGYEVTRTASAEAALGALANGRRVDIVFSDIMMPGEMDGVDLGREIRARRRNLPIVLSSGYAESALPRAHAEGFLVLPKPYGIEELATALRTAMDESGVSEGQLHLRG